MVIRQKASPALTPGLWCRAHFFSEKEKAGGGTGVEALLDVGEGEVREVIRQEGEEGAAHQTEIGEDVEPLLLRLGGHPHGRGCAALRRFIFQGRPAWFWPFHPTFLRTLRSEGLAPSVALAPGAFNNRSHVAMPRTSLTILPCSKKPVRPTSPRVTAIRQRTLPHDISAPTGSSSLVGGNVHRAKFSRLACNRKPKVRPGPVEQLIRAKK